MNPELPFTIKAYTASNQLIKSKELYLDDLDEIIRLFQDMHVLGVTTFFVKQHRIAIQYRLPQFDKLPTLNKKNGST